MLATVRDGSSETLGPELLVHSEVLQAVETVAGASGGRCIWAMDRGGDRRLILGALLRAEQRFVLGLRGDATYWRPMGRPSRRSTLQPRAGCPTLSPSRQEPGDEQVWPLRVGTTECGCRIGRA